MVAKEGLPIAKTLDWVDLKFEKEIKVPTDAWADWDAKNQKFITVGEKFPEGTTAVTKVTVVYPKDLFQTVKWQDGSPLTIGDFVFFMISNFDNGKPESPIFDEANQSNVAAFLQHFKGVKIVSTDPLVIDSGFQLMILWSFEQLGSGSLPCFAGRYRQFQETFPREGVQIAIRVTDIRQHGAHADMEFIDRQSGKLVARLEDYECVIDPSLGTAFSRNRLEEPVKAEAGA